MSEKTDKTRNRKSVASRLNGGAKNLHHILPKMTLEEAEDYIKVLQRELSAARKDAVTRNTLAREVLQLRDLPCQEVPSWMVKPKTKHLSTPGIPTLLVSDWHIGEKVDPNQVQGANEYNFAVAQKRVRALIENTINLLGIHSGNPKYPGIVFAIGGDMVTGEIHEELGKTNDLAIMPSVYECYGLLRWCISTLAERFGKVRVPCVTGNHGRVTHKIQSKDRSYTNYEWLVYRFLADHFANDSRVTFDIADGADVHYEVYGTRYLLTHGDSAKGGSGVSGIYYPLSRLYGDKLQQYARIGKPFDTLVCGHWHCYNHTSRFIVNGSLIGVSEYGWGRSYGYEPPRQALWLTHPEWGITRADPVYVERAGHKNTHSGF